MKIITERVYHGFIAYDDDTYEPGSAVMGGAPDTNLDITGSGDTPIFAVFQLLCEMGLEELPEYIRYQAECRELEEK